MTNQNKMMNANIINLYISEIQIWIDDERFCLNTCIVISGLCCLCRPEIME